MPSVVCIGNAVQDFVFAVGRIPDTPQKYRATDFETVGGGPAATAAVAVARLGGSASLITRVGDDAVAGVIVDELAEYGVDCTHVKRCNDCTSSLSAVLVDPAGERLIVNYLDETLPRDPAWVPDDVCDDASIVLADTRWPEGALHVFGLAKSRGLSRVLDADTPIPADGKLLDAATHIAFSSVALREYCQSDDLERGLADVANRTGAWCCVTRGADGVLCVHDDERVEVPAYAVEVRDTLGAGDVWHGAFALRLAEGESEREAVVFATAAAALKVTRSGGRAGTPTRGEVDAFLTTGNIGGDTT